MGESPGQNQAATTTMAVLEQGLKVYTSIHKRVYRALKSEFEKIFALNSRYLSQEEYFRVLDYTVDTDVNKMQEGQVPGPVQKVTLDDYKLGTADVFPAADPNVVTQSQKLLKAEALVPLMQAGLVNPQVAARRILEAQEQPNINELLEMPPPQPDPEQMLKEIELKHRMNYDKRKLELDEARISSEAIKDEMQAVLSHVKAESLVQESGREDVKLDAELISQEKGDEERVATASSDDATKEGASR